MINWLILAIAAIIGAVMAGFTVYVICILSVAALLAVYFEPKENEP